MTVTARKTFKQIDAQLDIKRELKALKFELDDIKKRLCKYKREE
ncbi:hypothetical protein [Chondrinema litorale]|nr:hypothetical protein [Chondrinema litorale]UZR94265.1 hypothetical protein OQ292_00350 [Chondrinema litorale]